MSEEQPSSRCQNHPDKQATGQCASCGLGLCDECSANADSPLCARCRSRAEEPRVAVGAYWSQAEAGFAQSLLQASGIPSAVVDGEMGGIAPHLNVAIGGIKVQVAESDLESARKLLADPESSGAVSEAEGQADLEAQSREDDEEEESSPVANAAEAVARRAMSSAVVGFFLIPGLLHLYSVVLLLQLWRMPGKLSSKGRTFTTVAAVIDALVLGGLIAAFAYATAWHNRPL